MSRLSEVTGLQQQRSLRYDKLKTDPEGKKIALMENMVESLNDISATLAIIADGNASNQSDSFESIARSLAMMANSN